MEATYEVNYNNQPLPLTTQVFCAQQEIIRNYADSGSCVIVGRCADYILRNRKDVLRVFIYADMEKRIEHSVKEYGMPEATACIKQEKQEPPIKGRIFL